MSSPPHSVRRYSMMFRGDGNEAVCYSNGGAVKGAAVFERKSDA